MVNQKTLYRLFSSISIPLIALETGAGCMAAFFFLLRNSSQVYPELISGSVAFLNSYKSGDFIYLTAFMISSISAFAIVTFFVTWLARSKNDSLTKAVKLLYTLCQAPMLFWLFSLTRSDGPFSLFFPSSSLFLSLLVTLYALCIPPKTLYLVKKYFFLLGNHLIAFVLSLFSGLGIDLALQRFLPFGSFYGPGNQVTIALLYGTFTVLWSMVLLRSQKGEKRFIGYLYLFSQAGIPLLYLYLIPSPTITGDTPINIHYSLYFLVMLACVGTWFDSYRRTKNINNVKLFTAWSPFALLAILCFVKIPVFTSTGIFPTDFYHQGEMLLPWKFLSQYGQIPYWDHVPARGISNYLNGLFAELFFTADFPSYIYAYILVISLNITVVFFAMRMAIGTLPAMLCLLIYPPPISLLGIHAVCVSIFILLFVLHEKLKVGIWPSVWFALGTAAVLYAPSQGGLMVMATIPTGLYWSFLAFKKETGCMLKSLGILTLCIGALLLFTPFGKMLMGAIRYGLEQGSVNAVAHGIPWLKSFTSKEIHYYNWLLWELVRWSWLLIGFWAGCIAIKRLQSKEKESEKIFILMAATIFLLAMLYIPRSAGRIDPDRWSRPGIASIVFFCLYFPLLLFFMKGIRSRIAAALLMTILATLYPNKNIRGETIIEKANFRSHEKTTLINANEYGLPALGMTRMPRKEIEELAHIKTVLDRFIKSGETYLDLTSKNVDYYIYNYPAPIECGAIYNLISHGQQMRAVEQLKKDPPPIVLASPAILHDGGNPLLRSYLITHYVLENYIPITDGHNIFYVNQQRLHETDYSGLGLISASRLELDKKAFYQSNLMGLPAAWGKSLSSFKDTKIQHLKNIDIANPIESHSVKMLNPNTYQITADDPYIIFDVTSTGLTGKEAGLLFIDIVQQSENNSSKTIEVFWENEINKIQSDFSLQALMDKGKLLFPMFSAPSWVTGGKIKRIRIDLPNEPVGSRFTFNNLSLWKRIDFSI